MVVAATEQGVAIPAFSSSLSYYDGYRRERGPANLIQGLRDYFGAHTYRRIDGDGSFHTRWGRTARRCAPTADAQASASSSTRAGNGCWVVKVPVTGGSSTYPNAPPRWQAVRAGPPSRSTIQ